MGGLNEPFLRRPEACQVWSPVKLMCSHPMGERWTRASSSIADAMPTQRGDGAFEVDGVPKDDGSDNEIETTRPVAFVYAQGSIVEVRVPDNPTSGN